MTRLLISAGPLINQSLSAAIATIAASFLLYNLFKGLGNRAARAYSLLLLFVLITYTADIGLSFVDDAGTADAWLRIQWLGIAFVPAAYVHFSHAILTMTGLPSRGRRLWGVRGVYAIATLFLLLVFATNLLVHDVVMEPAPHFRAGQLFPLFVAYFIGSVVLSVWFVARARQRTITQATHRRISQLLGVYVAPALAVFPFLLVSRQALASPSIFYAVLILVDAMLAVMLSAMSYSASFIGSLIPERLNKAQMMQFFLRGPVVAIATLAVILWVPSVSAFLGLPGEEVMPLLAVTTILLLQWAITLLRPRLERWLIYVGDQAEIRRIQELEERLLTGADFQQTLDTILTAVCDYLRVETAFVASLTGDEPHLERAVGLGEEFRQALASADEVTETARNGDVPPITRAGLADGVFVWQGFWLIPLHVQAEGEAEPRLIGLLGAAIPGPAETEQGEVDRWQILMGLASRASEVLEDRRIQGQVFASLEGLLPEMTTLERLREGARRGDVEVLTTPGEELVASPDFPQKIKDALTHYWGGPQLTDAALMRLGVVNRAMEDNDGNPQRAVRAVLTDAIENLRPEGQRSMTTAEWILYNILEMRFVQGRKVRDVAMRLAMSESDLYRKQRIAIETVAGIIADMEREVTGDDSHAASPLPEPNHS